MPDVLSAALAKMAKTEHPIAIPRHKFAVGAWIAEAARLEKTLRKGDDIVLQGKIQLPAFLPFWAKRLIRWTYGLFVRPRIEHRNPALGLLKAQIDELKELVERAPRDLVRGILTPLTIGETAEVQACYFQTRTQVSKALPEETSEDGQIARKAAIEFTSNTYTNAKRLECALKKSEIQEGDVQVLIQPITRALTFKQALALDPRVTESILTDYNAAFELTEDELGN